MSVSQNFTAVLEHGDKSLLIRKLIPVCYISISTEDAQTPSRMVTWPGEGQSSFPQNSTEFRERYPQDLGGTWKLASRVTESVSLNQWPQAILTDTRMPLFQYEIEIYYKRLVPDIQREARCDACF